MNSSSISSTERAVFPNARGLGTGWSADLRRVSGRSSTPGRVVKPGSRECSVGFGESRVAVVDDASVEVGAPVALVLSYRSIVEKVCELLTGDRDKTFVVIDGDVQSRAIDGVGAGACSLELSCILKD
jgi:hypothetical protein